MSFGTHSLSESQAEDNPNSGTQSMLQVYQYLMCKLALSTTGGLAFKNT